MAWPRAEALVRVGRPDDIREKHEQRFLGDLQKLQARVSTGRLREEAKVHEAIGRLKERYPRVARYYARGHEAGEDLGSDPVTIVTQDSSNQLKCQHSAPESVEVGLVPQQAHTLRRDMEAHGGTLREIWRGAELDGGERWPAHLDPVEAMGAEEL